MNVSANWRKIISKWLTRRLNNSILRKLFVLKIISERKKERKDELATFVYLTAIIDLPVSVTKKPRVIRGEGKKREKEKGRKRKIIILSVNYGTVTNRKKA